MAREMRTGSGRNQWPARLSIAVLFLSCFAAAARADAPGAASATPTPTPTPRALAAGLDVLPCVGDCDGDDEVSVSELILGVGMALGEDTIDECPAFDFTPDDRIMIDELLLSVAASSEGCGPRATPTSTPVEVTLARVQSMIFTPRCAVLSCHGGPFVAGGLNLEEGQSYDQLVGKDPQDGAAVALGLKRVDPFNPDNSFLVIKVEGPDSLTLGTRMPQLPPNLTGGQIQLIRDWIAQGANP
jgi:hypothetical protein